MLWNSQKRLFYVLGRHAGAMPNRRGQARRLRKRRQSSGLLGEEKRREDERREERVAGRFGSGEKIAANSAMNLVRFLLDCVPAICASTGLRFRHDSEFVCFFSFLFLIHFFNDSLVVFGISVLSVHSRNLQSSVRHNKEKGTEMDRKGREEKVREENFFCCCCDNFVYKSFGSFESVVVGGRGGEGQAGKSRISRFIICEAHAGSESIRCCF